MTEKTRYLMAGDKCLVVEFGDKIDESINNKVAMLGKAIEESNLDYIIEVVPTYRSLMVVYEPMLIDLNSLIQKIKGLENSQSRGAVSRIKVIEIPTIYGGEYGQDIDTVAKHNNLTIEEVINIHSSREYLIYMLGFTAGFPYLGGMDEKIATPRLKEPRIKIPGGSVGIAGGQTGIYPLESPGGWQLIGRTPLKLYDPHRENPVLLCAGDYLKFVAITKNEFDEIANLEKQDKYQVNIIEKDRG
jgi:KipI family sensor histidine kinase inhibitor